MGAHVNWLERFYLSPPTAIDLHNLFGFLQLRDHDHAQYEIRVYAQAMLQLIEPIVPCAVKAFKNLKRGTQTIQEKSKA